MKKFFTFVICAVMALPVFSKVIFKESFEQQGNELSVGTTQDDLVSTDYTNWYYKQVTGYNGLQVSSDANLTHANYCPETIGKGVLITARGCPEYRQFATINSGNIYMSALIKINSFPNSTKDVLLSLCQNKGSGTFDNFGRVYAYKTDNGFQLGIAKYSEASGYIHYTEDLILGETYLIVVKYEIKEGTQNDSVTLYINPNSSTEPLTGYGTIPQIKTGGGSEAGANSKNDAPSFGAVCINQSANTPRDMIIDELKVATTWADLGISDGDTPVVKPELDVTPSSIDFGKYISGQKYEKTFTVTGENLKEDITIGFKSPLSNISVSPTSIAKDNADLASGVTVTITVGEEREHDFSGSISVISGDLEKTVSVKGIEQVITYKDINQFSEFSADTETEDVIFTYKGTSAAISSIDEINQQIILKDVSNKTIAVQLSAAQWEGINPVVGMKIKELVFTAEKIIVPTLRILATPITISFKGPDFTREITNLDYGTICVKGIVQTATLESIDATFYKILYKEGDSDAPTNVVFEEVTELEENTPYIFKPNSTGTWKIYSKNAVSDQPNSENGLIGTFTNMTIEAGMYLIYNNMVCKAGTGCDLAANRAYINMSQVPTKEDGEPKAAPGMNRVSLVNPNGIPGSTTGCKTLNAKANYRKVMIGGNLVIINNDKKINVLGQTVK